MAEEAPHTGFAVTDGAEIQRTVGFTEAEILILSVKVTHLAGEGDYIGRIHAVAVIGNAESQLLVGLLHLRELLDATGVGIGADAVVRHAERNPYHALATFALANKLHDPGLLLVTNHEILAGLAVTVLLGQLVNHGNGLAGRFAALQGQFHKVIITQPAFRIAEFVPSAPGGFHNGNLVFVHEARHIVGVGSLGNEVFATAHGAEEAPDGYHFPFRMGSGSIMGQGGYKAEAVGIVRADDASVHGSLLSNNEVGACIRRKHAGEKKGRHGRKNSSFHMYRVFIFSGQPFRYPSSERKGYRRF